MKHTLSRALQLEKLEGRHCPSLTVSFFSGNLMLRGAPSGDVVVRETAPSMLHITEGGFNKGTYRVTGNLWLYLNYHPSAVEFDANGNRFGGNVYINLGTGDFSGPPDPVSVYSSAAGGSIGGSVTIQNGSGKELLNIGNPSLANLGSLTIGGNVNAYGKKSTGGFAGPGDTLFVGPGSRIGGNLTTSQIDNVDIGQPTLPLTTVGGTVTITDYGSGAALNVNIFGSINRSVGVTGTSFEDSFTLAEADPGVGGVINENLSVNLYGGGSFGNFFTLDANTSVGSAILSAQGSATPDLYVVAGFVAGDLTLNMGDGDNMVDFSASAIVGNMRVNAGNGNNDFTTNPFDGMVNGYLTFYLGNGANNATISNAPGSMLSWTSGSGGSTLQLASATTSGSQLWNVNVRFGSGDDVFTLFDNGIPQTLTGRADGGGELTGDIFNQGANWELSGPVYIDNFP